jgi:hypothetical protein
MLSLKNRLISVTFSRSQSIVVELQINSNYGPEFGKHLFHVGEKTSEFDFLLDTHSGVNALQYFLLCLESWLKVASV